MSAQVPTFASTTEIEQWFNARIEAAHQEQELQNIADCDCHRDECIACKQYELWQDEIDSLIQQTRFELLYFREEEMHAAFLDSVRGGMSKYSYVLEMNRLYTEAAQRLRALYFKRNYERSELRRTMMESLNELLQS